MTLPSENIPLGIRRNRMLNRFFDLVFSSVVILLSPLVLIPVSLAIKLTSKGPVFFLQDRTGRNGRSFKCIKFRTMYVNREADILQATDNDPRITPVGHFLRRSSLDEIPQFVNVLKGDMSVVGPRPHMILHTRNYSAIIDGYMDRHLVKPGITGWAQVHGFRGPTEEMWKMEQRVRYDLWYVHNWSLGLDAKILLRTFINAICGEKNAV